MGERPVGEKETGAALGTEGDQRDAGDRAAAQDVVAPLSRTRLIVETTLATIAILTGFALLIFIAVVIHIGSGPKTAGGTTRFSVLFGILFADYSFVVMVAYIAIGIGERRNNIWKTQLWPPLFAKAVALALLGLYTGMTALDLFLHDLMIHWGRVILDTDVRLIGSALGILLCATFLYQLYKLVISFGWQARDAARLIVSLNIFVAVQIIGLLLLARFDII